MISVLDVFVCVLGRGGGGGGELTVFQLRVSTLNDLNMSIEGTNMHIGVFSMDICTHAHTTHTHTLHTQYRHTLQWHHHLILVNGLVEYVHQVKVWVYTGDPLSAMTTGLLLSLIVTL